jgi:hypothetical protein
MIGLALGALRAGPSGVAEELSAFLPTRARIATERAVAAWRALGGARRPRDVVALAGPSSVDGGALRVVTDLRGDALGYWSELLFDGTPHATVLRSERPRARLAPRDDADLMLMSHHRLFREDARRAGWLTLPSWLDTGIPIADSIAATLAAQPQGRRSRESDLRRIRRAGFRPAIVRDAGAVRAFLRDWYLPYVHARWGETCVDLDAGSRRRAERWGEVLWVMRDGEPVAGLLLEDQGRELRMVVVGMVEAANRRDGALAAAYYFAIDEAVRRGRRWLRTGGTRPVLSDGVLEFKRKWGAHVRGVRQAHYLAMRCPGWTPAVRRLLARHPLVIEPRDGEFLACTVREAIERPPNEAARSMLELGGLAGALVPDDRGTPIRVALETPAAPAGAVASGPAPATARRRRPDERAADAPGIG